MYGSLPDVVYHLTHYLLAFGLLYLWLPRYLFTACTGSAVERYLSHFIRMVFFVIVVGYALVITRLYEVLAFVGVCALVILIRKTFLRKSKRNASAIWVPLLYDLLESPSAVAGIGTRLTTMVSGAWQRMKNWRGRLSLRAVHRILLVTVLVISAYLRFWDALVDPAPAMSDGYVTLAWIKYVNERILFHDGIYPQGYYFFMSLLGNLAVINVLYILKYTGPLVSTLTVWTLYDGVARMTENRVAGIVAASLYGVAGYMLLQGDWYREAATNSQEFSFLFVVPSMYFLHRYLQRAERRDLWTATAGLCVSGLVHTLGYALTACGWIAVMFAHFICFPTTRIRRLGIAALGMVASIGISAAPLLVGRWLGRALNQSSLSFATSHLRGDVLPPHLSLVDIVAVTSIFLLLILSLYEIIHGNQPVVWFAGAIFGLVLFAIYYFGGPVTRSDVVVARAQDLWAIAACVSIGVAVGAIGRWLRVFQWGQAVTVAALLCAGLATHPVVPIVPYKMEWDEEVQQYLDIDKDFRYQSYMIVSPALDYALILGDGYHMSTGDFLRTFDPSKPPLTLYGAHRPFTGISPNVFIFYFKQIYQVSRTNSIYALEKPIYQQEQMERTELRHWLAVYQKAGHKVAVFYDDSHLTVYYIHADSR